MAAPTSFHIHPPEWQRLLLASVHSVLTARDEQKPLKERSRLPVVTGTDAVAEALALRASGPPDRLALMSMLREHTCALDSATELIAVAFSCMRIEHAKCKGSGPRVCEMTGQREGAMLQLELLGNVHPKTGAPGRQQIKAVVEERWLPFLEACGVIGRMHEWLDDEVRKWLGASVTSFAMREFPDELRHLRAAYNAAVDYAMAAIKEEE